MHPYQHIFLHRGPSRVFWFLLGAGFATWWHHSSSMRDHRAQYFPCVVHHRRAQDSSSDTPTQEVAPWKSFWGPDQTTTGWHQQREWEQEKERLSHLQKRAGETVADLSESTLNSIISGAETLKTKLAELRAERERLETQKKAAQPDA